MAFRHLLGHRATLSLLARALDAGTLPPSLILGGPEGVGKRQAAIAIAQTANCPTPLHAVEWPDAPDAPPLAIDACGECAVCRRIARGVHPDVTLIEPGENGSIRIEVAREEIRKTGFKPFEARRRVAIFDNADTLTADAQDSLLKTLEEPPPSSVLILVTAHPDLLLSTVRSRCAVVRFAPLAPADVAGWLMHALGLPEARARAVAAVSEGSLAQGREAADQTVEGVRASAQRVLERVADARDPRDRLEATRDLVGKGKGSSGSERQSLAVHLRAVAALLRDVGVLATGADRGHVVNADLDSDLSRLAQSFPPQRAVNAFSAIDQALGALDRNASPKTVADWLVLQL